RQAGRDIGFAGPVPVVAGVDLLLAADEQADLVLAGELRDRGGRLVAGGDIRVVEDDSGELPDRHDGGFDVRQHAGGGPLLGETERGPEDGCAQRTPSGLGTESLRGSSSTAGRGPRAKALYWASTMWCGSRPRTRSRWTVSPPWKAMDSSEWEVIEPVK